MHRIRCADFLPLSTLLCYFHVLVRVGDCLLRGRFFDYCYKRTMGPYDLFITILVGQTKSGLLSPPPMAPPLSNSITLTGHHCHFVVSDVHYKFQYGSTTLWRLLPSVYCFDISGLPHEPALPHITQNNIRVRHTASSEHQRIGHHKKVAQRVHVARSTHSTPGSQTTVSGYLL